mmetsp:Transcript_37380/g.87578  ORF Transcript_37380/g.87578 Transcript_37380/m.87578 type:complete len:95 (-) Transcript_37380:138-422(-)
MQGKPLCGSARVISSLHEPHSSAISLPFSATANSMGAKVEFFLTLDTEATLLVATIGPLSGNFADIPPQPVRLQDRLYQSPNRTRILPSTFLLL